MDQFEAGQAHALAGDRSPASQPPAKIYADGRGIKWAAAGS